MSMRLVLLAALAFPATADAGPCAMRPLAPHVISVAGSSIANNGGIVVALSDSGEGTGELSTWRLRDGTQRTKPVITTLAPGLMVIALPATGAAIVLEDGAHAEQLAVRRGGKVEPMGAPRVRKVAMQRITSGAGPRTMTMDENLVDLLAAPPTEAIALVIFGIDNDVTVPRSWASVDHAQEQVVVYHAPGRCQTLPPGMVASASGDHVAFAWVDRSGRLSAMSTATIVIDRVDVRP